MLKVEVDVDDEGWIAGVREATAKSREDMEEPLEIYNSIVTRFPIQEQERKQPCY